MADPARTAGSGRASGERPVRPVSEALVTVSGLTKHYPVRSGWFGKAALRAVDGVSLTLGAGETLGLVGESGCGKSTVARCLLRLVDPTGGRIVFDGVDLLGLGADELRRRRRDFQMVFQDPTASLNPRLTVGRTVEEPLLLHADLAPAERRGRVREILDEVGLDASLVDRYPHELSGGQRQRVNVARAVATRPRFVVLDEPTSALDVSLRARVILMLAELQRRLGLSYLFISHDLATVKYLSDRVAVMYLGTVVEEAPSRELFHHPAHPYTRALLSAIPVPDPDVPRDRLPLAGEVPSPIDIPRGCRLRGRCPLAQPVCAEPVPWREVAPGHFAACHLV
ncbi:MAG: ATP-binding cassette domain-containing protein [Candidatus Rokubacteria bacterium]|nr:ATP-binding cassette domain-containing protein [Candidatus Rokubacteria bacterium]